MVAGGCVAQPGAFRPEVLQTSLALYETTLPWWNQPESNRQHPACKAGALPIELWPRGRRGGIRTPADFSRGPKPRPVPGYGLLSDVFIIAH